MAIAQSVAKLVRNVHAASEVSPQVRQTWLSWLSEQQYSLWPGLSSEAKPVLDRKVQATNGGRMVRGRIEDVDRVDDFWIKWCPDAALPALDQTAARMRWWQEHHADLSGPVARVIGYWPEQKILLLEHRAGRPLGRLIESGSQHVDAPIAALGNWLRGFAEGHLRYDTGIASLLGTEVRQNDDGSLVVDSRPLIVSRLSYARQAADRLSDAGFGSARLWADRFDIKRILDSFRNLQPAGFIHGDLNPDNVLVSGDEFSVIDWWTAPRVSWPLQDVATFAANLWLYSERESAGGAWQTFADNFFLEDPEEPVVQAVDLLGTMMCLGLLARKLDSSIDRIVSRRWCKAVLERLVAPESTIGSYTRQRVGEITEACGV